MIEQISELTGFTYQAVHVVGGGARNSLLNQMIADACGIEVIAGPEEATALGNLLMQAVVCGELSSLRDIRHISMMSCIVKEFEPGNGEPWKQAHEKMAELKNIVRS